ncbi:MAG: hypothetical protein JO099_03700 [Acidobacteriia bacterium]|nr:hypothetical protein [Terriglobia bacterium]
MKNRFSVLVITALALLSAASSRADVIYSADFTGTVYQTQGSTGQSVGSTVTAHFDLDGTTGSFLDFMIAGKSVAPGYTSFASIGPALTDGIYTAQVSALSTGMSSNSTFSLDLSSLNTWPSSDTAYTLLTDKAQLMTNLDTIGNPLSAFPSTFSYYTADADGTSVVALAADLTSINATAVPEPAGIALTAPLLLALGFFVRRRV